MAGLGSRLNRIVGHFTGSGGPVHLGVKRAAWQAAERLEPRQLLSLTPAEAHQFRHTWNHPGPHARHDIAVAEYVNPNFAATINADVTALGLKPIAPL